MECLYTKCGYNTIAGCTFEYMKKVKELNRAVGLRGRKKSIEIPNFSSPGVLEIMTKVVERRIRIIRGTKVTRRQLETAITI